MPTDPHSDQKVVTMSQFASANRYQPLREVDAYWEALRAGRLVPRRSDIDPRGIERALEYAFILERIAPTLARLRIAGSHLTDLMGMEVRGMPLSALFASSSRNAIGDALEEAFSGPSKVELVLRAERSLGKPEMEARMILLPLKSDLGDISRVLGCLCTYGAIGRAPRRFELLNQEVTPLLGDARIREGIETAPDDEEDDDMPEVEAPTTRKGKPRRTRLGLSEDQTRFEPGPKPYLRLVRTDTEE